jgi:hypothetical protein
MRGICERLFWSVTVRPQRHNNKWANTCKDEKYRKSDKYTMVLHPTDNFRVDDNTLLAIGVTVALEGCNRYSYK